MSDKIREQIATCRRNADDQTMCGVDVGRTGPCHGAWQWDDVADSLQSLLDENERLTADAKRLFDGREEQMVAQDARIEKLETALAWLVSEVERDHELDRLSIDSEYCAIAAKEVLTEAEEL